MLGMKKYKSNSYSRTACIGEAKSIATDKGNLEVYIKATFRQIPIVIIRGTSWSWSYGSWMYNYLWNQCLSSLTLRVRIPVRWGVLDTTICDSLSATSSRSVVYSEYLVSSTHKTDRHDITEILLKVALKHHNPTPIVIMVVFYWFFHFVLKKQYTTFIIHNHYVHAC